MARHKALEATGKQLGGCTGKGFMPGQSGNPKGFPKGGKKYRFLRVIEQAMDAATETKAVEAFRDAVGNSKRVLDALNTGGRFTREIGSEAEDATRAVRVYIVTNVDPTKLRSKKA